MTARNNNNIQLELVWLLQRGAFTAPDLVAKIGGDRGGVFKALKKLKVYGLAESRPGSAKGRGSGRTGKPAHVWEWVRPCE